MGYTEKKKEQDHSLMTVIFKLTLHILCENVFDLNHKVVEILMCIVVFLNFPTELRTCMKFCVGLLFVPYSALHFQTA